MPEPALGVFPVGRNFTRSRLRDAIGPSNSLYHLLERLCTDDVYVLYDDFDGPALDTTNNWTVTNSGGAAVANFAVVADGLCGLISGDPGTDDDADVRLRSQSVFDSGNRPLLIARVRPTTVANSKFEIGFQDGDNDAGAVLVKATPTSTAGDYAVAILDTDDSANLDFRSDGTTDAAAGAASSPVVTPANATFYTVMIALNERRECRLWVDGVLSARLTSGPDTGTALGVWAYAQNRGNTDNRIIRLDYVLALQERVAV